jgi:hypothetical protein
VRLATSRQAQHVRRLREVLSLAIQAPELATAGLDQHKFHRLFAIGAIGGVFLRINCIPSKSDCMKNEAVWSSRRSILATIFDRHVSITITKILTGCAGPGRPRGELWADQDFMTR